MEKRKTKASTTKGRRASKIDGTRDRQTADRKAPSKKLNKQDEVEDADHLTIKEKEQITNSEEQKKIVNSVDSVDNAHDEEDEEIEKETSGNYRDDDQLDENQDQNSDRPLKR
ncbi:hypothetical protein BH10BAC4_BH10BAC4_22960 [soil metagenome]